MVVELPGIVKPLSRLRMEPCGPSRLKDAQIPVRVTGALLFVGHRYIGPDHLAKGRNHFMDRSHPHGPSRISDDALPIIRKRRIPGPVESGVILHHDHVHRGRERSLQVQKLFPVLHQQYIVGIQPHAVFHARLGESKVPRRREVVYPGKLAYPVRISRRDLTGGVGAPRIHHHNLVYQPRSAV